MNLFRLDHYGRETGVQERERDRAGNVSRIGEGTDQHGRVDGQRRPNDGGGQRRRERDRRFGDNHDGGRSAGRPAIGQQGTEQIAGPQLPRAAEAVRLRVAVRHQGQWACRSS